MLKRWCWLMIGSSFISNKKNSYTEDPYPHCGWIDGKLIHAIIMECMVSCGYQPHSFFLHYICSCICSWALQEREFLIFGKWSLHLGGLYMNAFLKWSMVCEWSWHRKGSPTLQTPHFKWNIFGSFKLTFKNVSINERYQHLGGIHVVSLLDANHFCKF